MKSRLVEPPSGTSPTDIRNRLIDAADSAFQERGYRDATVQQISAQARLTTGAIYSRFVGKEGLFLATLDRRSEQQRRAWEGYISAAIFDGGSPDGLGKVLLSVLPKPTQHRALLEFLASASLSEESRAALLERSNDWFDLLGRLLDIHCRLVGIAPRVPVAELAKPVAALIDGLMGMALIDPDLDTERLFISTLDALLMGAGIESEADGTEQ